MDEIRPGNFVFYDLTQTAISSCKAEQIAVAMACPLVAKHYDRSEWILYGGGVHLSKDRLSHNGEVIYGRVVWAMADGWEMPEEEIWLTSLSQEHGKVRLPSGLMDRHEIGDLVYVLPVHSCMSADLMKHLVTTSGDLITMMDYSRII